MTARRGLNLAYARIVENMNKEEREEFDSELTLSLVDLQIMKITRDRKERETRQRLAVTLGEVG